MAPPSTSARPPRTSSTWSRAGRACSGIAVGRVWREVENDLAVLPGVNPADDATLSRCRTSWRPAAVPARPADRTSSSTQHDGEPREGTRRFCVSRVSVSWSVPGKSGPARVTWWTAALEGKRSGVLARFQHCLQECVEVLGQPLAGGAFVAVERNGAALRLLQAHALLDDRLQHGVPEEILSSARRYWCSTDRGR